MTQPLADIKGRSIQWYAEKHRQAYTDSETQEDFIACRDAYRQANADHEKFTSEYQDILDRAKELRAKVLKAERDMVASTIRLVENGVFNLDDGSTLPEGIGKSPKTDVAIDDVDFLINWVAPKLIKAFKIEEEDERLVELGWIFNFLSVDHKSVSHYVLNLPDTLSDDMKLKLRPSGVTTEEQDLITFGSSLVEMPAKDEEAVIDPEEVPALAEDKTDE